MNPGVTCTPWLFWELTRDVADDVYLNAALGGTLVVLASVLMDHLSDGQAAQPGPTALLQQALYEGGAARLRATLAGESSFWLHFERLGREHLAGLAAELEVQLDPAQLTFERFVEMVPPKFSPIVITMAAFLCLLGREDLLDAIEASIKHLAVASQLLDDMGDWEDDLQARHLTYYLSRLATPEAWLAPNWPAREQLQYVIDGDWLDVKHMSEVQEWLDRSLEDVLGLECEGWTAYLEGYRSLAEQHLAHYKARHMLRIIGPIVEARGASPTTTTMSAP